MSLLAAGALLILLGGLGAVMLRRQARTADALAGLLLVAGCALSATAALRALAGYQAELRLPTPALPGGAWELGLDGLSAWFLLLLSVVGGATSVYGIAYLAAERDHRSIAPVHFLWSVLLVAMMAVLVARSAIPFLVSWEIMAVSAYFLILFEHEREEARRSGLVYLVLTHFGTLGLLLMFLAWGRRAPDLTFLSLAAQSPDLAWSGAGVLLLALFGFGVKAGLFPFHFWLPGAHAAAPSHVSALLSGVMLKMGIYGLFRVLSLLGPPPAWWGWTTLLLGLTSALLGVLWALAQHDLKRVLAYSSVENIGIILMGVGLGGLGTAYHNPAVALIGYTAALLHTFNHALFKSLLFLGAGAIVRSTGTREIDRLGGLARRLPGTALLFATGALAIAGLPPLNGFVSEWLLVQGFLTAGAAGDWLRFACLGVTGLAIVGALVVACFTRLFGILMLGQPRDTSVIPASDADRGMLLPMCVLGFACLAIGLWPSWVVSSALRLAGSLGNVPGPADPTALVTAGALRDIPILGGVLIALGVVMLLVRRALRPPADRRVAATWGCGYSRPTSRMQYTASSFGAPLAHAFSAAVPLNRVPAPGRFRTVPQDRVFHNLMRPLWNRLQAVALALRPLQQGRLRTYLSFMIWTLILLLGFLYFSSSAGRP